MGNDILRRVHNKFLTSYGIRLLRDNSLRRKKMASTPEARVKKVVTTYLKQMGAYYFYPMTGGYGRSGVPDIIGCHEGKFFGIECKAGKNKPTPLQYKNLTDIASAGGIALVVSEVNMHDTVALVSGTGFRGQHDEH